MPSRRPISPDDLNLPSIEVKIEQCDFNESPFSCGSVFRTPCFPARCSARGTTSLELPLAVMEGVFFPDRIKDKQLPIVFSGDVNNIQRVSGDRSHWRFIHEDNFRLAVLF